MTPARRLMHRSLLAIGRLSRGMTLGVRAALMHDAHVVLVRHSYLAGWYFPGGGVEPGESVFDALEREIREEAGATLTGPARLFGVYRNATLDPRDHVALFVCREFALAPAAIRNLEIREARSFPLAALPEGTTPATRARLAEVNAGAIPAVDW
jgi:8-oxo-dGTP pyrophosphatase MutT (NUDIX family)